MRIMMPQGHTELCLAGVSYKQDDEGAFDVPDHHAKELLLVHPGSELAPQVQDLDVDADAADTRVKQAEFVLEQLRRDAKVSRERAVKGRAKAEAGKAAQEAQKQKEDAEAQAKAKAETEAKAKAEADAAAANAKATGKK